MKRRFSFLLPLVVLAPLTIAGCAERDEPPAAGEPASQSSPASDDDGRRDAESESAKERGEAEPSYADPPADPQAASPSPGAAPKTGAGEAGAMGRADKGKSGTGWSQGEDGKSTEIDPGLFAGKDASNDRFFQHYGVNPTIDTAEEPRSTFAVDVDNASYTLTRSFLERGQLPVEAAVRVEEVVNAFDYGYEAPSDATFSIHAEAAPSPNRRGYHVLHVGIKGKEIAKAERKPATLVFVVDVSGSMDAPNRLGLVKQSLKLLVDQLGEADRVGIVAYGSTARELLAPTSAHHKARILQVIDGMQIEGATNAEAGLRLGYQMAERHLKEGHSTRVILCSDGVANVGLTGPSGLLETVERQTRRGITISTVGFGMGTYNDVLMEKLANGGDGNYYYVDKIDEARRVFVEQLTGTLEVIAKDVKIQVEFDPAVVSRYRLIGYENRALAAQQFDDDRVDAGEVGAGHAVTAIYEVKLEEDARGPLGKVRVRYKQPRGGASQLVEQALSRSVVRSSAKELSSPTQLSLVAAQFAEKLRGSYWARNVTYEDIKGRLALIKEPLRHRSDVVELERLIAKAAQLDKRGDKFADHGPVAMMDFDRVPILR